MVADVSDLISRVPGLEAALEMRLAPKHVGVLAGRWRILAGVGAIFAALTALALRSGLEAHEHDNFVCPPGLRRKVSVMQNEGHTRARNISLADPPSVLLKEIKKRLHGAPSPLKKSNESERGLAAEALKALKACVSWELPQTYEPRIGTRLAQHNSMSTLLEVRSQLECWGVLLDHFGEPNGSDGGAWESSESIVWKQSMQLVGQSRALLQRCVDLTTELQALRRARGADRDTEKPQPLEAPGRALSALMALADLEPQYRETLEALAWSQRILNTFAFNQTVPTGSGSGNTLDDKISDSGDGARVQSMRTDLRGSLLRAIREARLVAAKLPQSHPQVRTAVACNPELLVATEELALQEIGKEVDPAFVFALGMQHSEMALMVSANAAVPFFGFLQGITSTPTKALDEFGLEVPATIATAELYLLQAAQSSTSKGTSLPLAGESRASLRAKRLLNHAQGVLAPLQLHAAVAQRLRKAAEIFASEGQTKLAARVFSDLAEHKLRRGRHEEALAVAGEALSQNRHEAVALYLQATLMMGLGELRSREDIKKAKKQLQEAAGRLPTKTLEEKRAAAHSELWAWGVVADRGDFRTCFELHDAARVLICLICRLTMTP